MKQAETPMLEREKSLMALIKTFRRDTPEAEEEAMRSLLAWGSEEELARCLKQMASDCQKSESRSLGVFLALFMLALILGGIATSAYNGVSYHLGPLLTGIFAVLGASAMILGGAWGYFGKNTLPALWKRKEIHAKKAALVSMGRLALRLPTKAFLPSLLALYAMSVNAQSSQRRKRRESAGTSLYWQVIERMTQLLPTIDASDTNLLDSTETERLTTWVLMAFVVRESPFYQPPFRKASENRDKGLAFVRAILSALKHVGTEAQMLRLQKLTEPTARTSGQAEISQAVQNVLPEWQARLLVQNTPQTLLRASAATHETLLRPVVSQPVDPQQLLRPGSPEEQK